MSKLHFEHGGGSEIIISDEQTGEQLFVMEPDDLLRAVAFHYDLDSENDVLRALELFELERRGVIRTRGFILDLDRETKLRGIVPDDDDPEAEPDDEDRPDYWTDDSEYMDIFPDDDDEREDYDDVYGDDDD